MKLWVKVVSNLKKAYFRFQNMKTQKFRICYNAVVPNFYNILDVSHSPVLADGK